MQAVTVRQFAVGARRSENRVAGRRPIDAVAVFMTGDSTRAFASDKPCVCDISYCTPVIGNTATNVRTVLAALLIGRR